MYNNIYKDRKVLVTGNTGFKGSWLSLLLLKLGAQVSGVALPPATEPSHFDLLRLWDRVPSHQIDLRKPVLLPGEPEIVFHLAAQAIVAKTFDDPAGTFETNVMGAVNILEACRKCPTVKAVVMITTDKVYANKEWDWGYRENDELGGHDPYSASKVCVEYVIECYRKNYIPMIATARAGNVIGGGDWSYKRLIPDIMKATAKGKPVEIHTPYATRPWQHVLEPLHGYLLLGQKLLEGKQEFATAFGMGPVGEMTVLEVLQVAKGVWPKIEYVVKEEGTHPHMVYKLRLDSTKAIKELGWIPLWPMRTAIRKTVNWYREYYEHGNVISDNDIEDYYKISYAWGPK